MEFCCLKLNQNCTSTPMSAVTVNFSPLFDLTDDAFYQFCRNNPDVRFERTAKGELIVMPPLGGEGGKREADLITDPEYMESSSEAGRYIQFFHWV
jgi:hypothetical protein